MALDHDRSLCFSYGAIPQGWRNMLCWTWCLMCMNHGDHVQSTIIKTIDPMVPCQTWPSCRDSLLHLQQIVISEVGLPGSEMRPSEHGEKQRQVALGSIQLAATVASFSDDGFLASWSREHVENFWGRIPSNCTFTSWHSSLRCQICLYCT